jgi:hypothetical protein
MGKYLSLDRDITFLDIILIALSIFLWHKLELCLKRLQNSQGIVIGFSSAGGASSLNF